MAATGTATLNGVITGLPNGSVVLGPLVLSSAAANGTVQIIALASGANTITIPTAPVPKGVLVVLPSDNTVVTTIKGVTGDTGFVVSKTGWFFLPFDTVPPANFVLTSASAQTAKYTYIYFF